MTSRSQLPQPKQLVRMQIAWTETADVDFPYEATLDEHRLRLRLNDFPDEPLFSLFADDIHLADFDDWPPTWQR